MPSASDKVAVESDFTSHDGVALHYRHWPAAQPGKRALLLFHRGHEHSARWQETVEALALEDVDIFAWDARGHGASPGERGAAEHIGMLIRDVDAFVRHVTARHGIAMEDMIVVAHSVGAVVVAAWVHDFAPPIRGLVLATPAFRVRLYVPFSVPLLRLRQRLFGPGYVKSYVKARMLTHDVKQARLYAEDATIFRQIAVNVLLDLHDTGTRLVADAGAIRVPVLMLAAGADWVVENGAQRKFFARLSSADKTFRELPGFHHAIFHESDRAVVVEQLREFVARLFLQPRSEPPSLRDADRAGYTKTEYYEMREAPHTLSARAIRVAFSAIGPMSDGIALGLRSGFDSGETLDYVYENKPRGTNAVGITMDRAYLESPGWSGIRARRQHLEEMLCAAMRELHAAGGAVHILDAACGAGRYVLESIAALPEVNASALLRDYKQQNLDTAERLRAELKLDRVKIVRGDAFDRDSFANLDPRPTIGIVSGLLELFPDNESARRCFAGFADAIKPGGILLYTGQPWHPQLRFIAGVLDNREGKPWIMRRRTQEELDELVRAAGFVKEAQAVDRWGIFTVSRARRAAA
ncbi:MAG: bifunctional alpha/beta hydrolase/class I SAM-dependent methyltransferase [Chthoniobacteraceae bacterium]